MENVYIKKLSEKAILPRKGTEGAIAYDLAIPRNYAVKPGRQIIPLDIAIEMPKGMEFKIEPRSGFSAKGMLGNDEKRYNADVLVGKIDSDYRGNIGVIVKSEEHFMIEGGTFIAQGTFYNASETRLVETDTLSETERGEGGFGSTGKK